jgi:hypothetical protein
MCPRIQTQSAESSAPLEPLAAITIDDGPGTTLTDWDSLSLADAPLEELVLAWERKFISVIPAIKPLDLSYYFSRVTFPLNKIFLGSMKENPLEARDVSQGLFFTPKDFIDRVRALPEHETAYACGSVLNLDVYYLWALSQIPQFPGELHDRLLKKQKDKECRAADLPVDAAQDLDFSFVLRLNKVDENSVKELRFRILSILSDLTGNQLDPDYIRDNCLGTCFIFKDYSKIVISVGRGHGNLSDGQPDHSFDCTFYCVKAGDPSPQPSSIFFSNSGTVNLQEHPPQQRCIHELIDSVSGIIRQSGPINRGTLPRLAYDLSLGKHLCDLNLPRKAFRHVHSPTFYLDGVLKHKKILSANGLFSVIINTYTLVFPFLCSEEKELWTIELMRALKKMSEIDPHFCLFGGNLELLPEYAEGLSLRSTLELTMSSSPHLKPRSDGANHWVSRQLSQSYSAFLPLKIDYILSDAYLTKHLDEWLELYDKMAKDPGLCFSKLNKYGITDAILYDEMHRYQERQTPIASMMSLIYMGIASKGQQEGLNLSEVLLKLTQAILCVEDVKRKKTILRATSSLFPGLKQLEAKMNADRSSFESHERVINSLFTTFLPEPRMRETLFQVFQKMLALNMLEKPLRAKIASSFIASFLESSSISRAILVFDRELKTSSRDHKVECKSSYRIIFCIRNASQSKVKPLTDTKTLRQFLEREYEERNEWIKRPNSKDEFELGLWLTEFLDKKIPPSYASDSPSLQPYCSVLQAGPEGCVEPLIKLLSTDSSNTSRTFLSLLPFTSPIISTLSASWIKEGESPFLILLDALLSGEDVLHHEHVRCALVSPALSASLSRKQKYSLARRLCFQLLKTSASNALDLSAQCIDDTKMMAEHPPFHLALCIRVLEMTRVGGLDVKPAFYMNCVRGLLQHLPEENKSWKHEEGIISATKKGQRQVLSWPIDSFEETRDQLLDWLRHGLTNPKHSKERKAVYALLRVRSESSEKQALILFEDLSQACEEDEAYDLLLLACRMLPMHLADTIDEYRSVFQTVCSMRDDTGELKDVMSGLGKEMMYEEISSESHRRSIVDALDKQDGSKAMKHALALNCHNLRSDGLGHMEACLEQIFDLYLERMKVSRNKKEEANEIFLLLKKQSFFMPRDDYFSQLLHECLAYKMPGYFFSLLRNERELLSEHCSDLEALTVTAILQMTPLTEDHCRQYLDPLLNSDANDRKKQNRFDELLDLYLDRNDYKSLKTVLSYFERQGLQPSTCKVRLALIHSCEDSQKLREFTSSYDKGYLRDASDEDLQAFFALGIEEEKNRKSGTRLTVLAERYRQCLKALSANLHPGLERDFQTDMGNALAKQNPQQLEGNFTENFELFPNSAATTKRWLDCIEKYFEKDDKKRMTHLPFLLRFLPRIAPLIKHEDHVEQKINCLFHLWERTLIFAEGSEFKDKELRDWFTFLDTFKNELDQSQRFSFLDLMRVTEIGDVSIGIIAASVQCTHKTLMRKPDVLAQIWLQIVQKASMACEFSLKSTLIRLICPRSGAKEKSQASELLSSDSVKPELCSALLASFTTLMIRMDHSHTQTILQLYDEVVDKMLVDDFHRMYINLALANRLSSQNEDLKRAQSLLDQARATSARLFPSRTLRERVYELGSVLWRPSKAKVPDADARARMLIEKKVQEYLASAPMNLSTPEIKKTSIVWKVAKASLLNVVKGAALGLSVNFGYRKIEQFNIEAFGLSQIPLVPPHTELGAPYPQLPQNDLDLVTYYSACSNPRLACPRLEFAEYQPVNPLGSNTGRDFWFKTHPPDGKPIIPPANVYVILKVSEQFRVRIPSPPIDQINSFISNVLRSGNPNAIYSINRYFANLERQKKEEFESLKRLVSKQ